MQNLKEKLQKNILTIGSRITIWHQSVVEIMCSAWFERLVIDMEHSVIELEVAQQLIGLIQANKNKALVRVSKNEEVIIKRVMDAWADWVIVPMINSKEDAEQAVNYVKYPPVWKRGVGLARAQKYGIWFDEYKRWLNKESIVIAQVEHIESVKNIEEILQTEWIDWIIIWPYDLSWSMWIPWEYHKKEVKDAIKKVEDACKKYNKPMWSHVIESDSSKIQEKISAWYTFLAFSLDFFFLWNKVRDEMKKLNITK